MSQDYCLTIGRHGQSLGTSTRMKLNVSLGAFALMFAVLLLPCPVEAVQTSAEHEALDARATHLINQLGYNPADDFRRQIPLPKLVRKYQNLNNIDETGLVTAELIARMERDLKTKRYHDDVLNQKIQKAVSIELPVGDIAKLVCDNVVSQDNADNCIIYTLMSRSGADGGTSQRLLFALIRNLQPVATDYANCDAVKSLIGQLKNELFEALTIEQLYKGIAVRKHVYQCGDISRLQKTLFDHSFDRQYCPLSMSNSADVLSCWKKSMSEQDLEVARQSLQQFYEVHGVAVPHRAMELLSYHDIADTLLVGLKEDNRLCEAQKQTVSSSKIRYKPETRHLGSIIARFIYAGHTSLELDQVQVTRHQIRQRFTCQDVKEIMLHFDRRQL